MFIVLEGLDGAGTSTQLKRLEAVLRAEGRQVRATREPSDGPVGVMIRQALRGRLRQTAGAPIGPEALALLFAADRLDHLRDVVEPDLAAGRIVLSDRYVHSSLAYQGVECDPDWVVDINSRARDPDLVIYVEVDVETSLGRIFGRGDALERFEQEEMLEAVRDGYEQAFRARPCNVVRVDGSGSPNEVQARVLDVVRQHLS
ncbi:MAG: dTMP kinase [Deltaproteobacteria bacterium]|nr:MAG: dTMP kinase [Deltaproteobacteria bacterium]